MSSPLDVIAGKVAASDRLTPEEVGHVIASDDLLGIGALADQCRRRKHGDVVTFVRVQMVPLSPVPDAIAVASGAGELRLVGEPKSAQAAVAATERTVGAAGGVPVTGFTLGQLASVCGDDGERLVELLTALSQAGLTMVSEVRLDDERSWEWLGHADRAGLEVARLALASESAADDVDGLRRIATAGTAVEHVRTLAPLAGGAGAAPTTGFRDVRRVALARLLVDNIDSIQVDWGHDGPKLAQVALAFGADDVDAVSPDDSAEQGWRRSPLEEITRNICAASLVPSQRDGRFGRLDA